MNKEKEISVLEPGTLAQKIFIIRGEKVMLDSHLAELYQVGVKRLNEQVKRNIERFPSDFAFQLTAEETENLKSQIATSSLGHGGKRKRSFVFTEHGVAMLSSVLRSDRAVQMNIFIIRAFVKLREVLATHKDLAQKLEELERRQDEHGDQLSAVYDIVKQLIDEPPQNKEKIGFTV
jgi:phage regulator Rha-like protein